MIQFVFVLVFIFPPSDVSASVYGIGQYAPALSNLVTTLNSNIWQLSLSTQYKTVAAGSNYLVMIDNNGALYSVGQNDYGELGVGDVTARTTPTLVAALFTASAVFSGAFHLVALDSTSNVWTWGSNSAGQLGQSVSSLAPAQVSIGEGGTSAAVGAAHTLLLGVSGRVYACGAAAFGQLGLGDISPRSTPTLLPIFTQYQIGSISAGAYHSLALTTTSMPLAWGSNSAGQVGGGTMNSTLSPTLIPQLSAVSALYAGCNTSLFLLSTGALFALGDNSQGQFGIGDTISRTTPVLLSGALGAVRGACISQNFALFLSPANVLYAAGISILPSSRRTSGSSLITIVGFSGSVETMSSSAMFAVVSTQEAGGPLLAVGAIVAICVCAALLIIATILVLFLFLRRRNHEKESMRTIKVQSEARMRLGMALGEDVLALEDHTHRTWSMMPHSKDPNKSRQPVEELDKLPPWKPSENDEPIMAFRIVTNQARIKASRIAAALLMMKCPGTDKKTAHEAAAILQEYASTGEEDTLSNPLTNESMDDDYEPPQLEASVVPGPVHGWLRQRAELQVKAEQDAINLVNEFRKSLSSKTEPEIGLT